MCCAVPYPTTAQRGAWPGKSSDRQTWPETSLVGTRLATSTWRPSWTGQVALEHHTGEGRGGRERHETPSLLREEAALVWCQGHPLEWREHLAWAPPPPSSRTKAGCTPPCCTPLVFSCQAAALLWDAAIKGTEA